MTDLAQRLIKASHKYYITGTPELTDAEFDALEAQLKAEDPLNPYFLGVGSPNRSEDKVPLACTMGSLDQVHAGGDMVKWIIANNLQNEILVFTDKLDGNSGLLTYNKSNLQMATTRGDGVNGKDITRHVFKMTNCPNMINSHGQTLDLVAGEFIIPDDVFEEIKSALKAQTGQDYKNPRNFVAGQLNKDVACDLFYQNCRFVAFNHRNSNQSKTEELNLLANLGFEIPGFRSIVGRLISDVVLTQHVQTIKGNSPFALDGVVIDIDSDLIRTRLSEARLATSSSLNPAYARKFKIKDESNEATTVVKSVEWNISKDGLLKPTVLIVPVDLVGVTISRCTGFNAKFIRNNQIGKGAVIKITRAGDVIPHIEEVMSSAESGGDMPEGDYTFDWTPSGVDLIITSGETKDQKLKQIQHFFSHIGVMGLGLPSVEKMFNCGFNTLVMFIKASKSDWQDTIGMNGVKVHASIKKNLNCIKSYTLAGSHPAYGTGIGRTVMKKIFDVHGIVTGLSLSQLTAVPGIEEKTALKILDGENDYLKFIYAITGCFVIDHDEEEVVTGGNLEGQYFLFTGVRDKDLQLKLEAAGAEVSNSVAKFTTLVAKDVNGTSGKLKKARVKGLPIISLDQARKLV